ncbi:hypothetical protein ACQUQP_17945 [Marinobacterium sp. YM272]|uniref:hypothetical protein n=1 Tax=Marinobacterium sp. YM272 TaxID=3421654 RepID=UPI003D7F9A6D
MKLPRTIPHDPDLKLSPQALFVNSAAAMSNRTSQLQTLVNNSLNLQSTSLSRGMPFFMSLAKGEPDTLSELFQLQQAIAGRFMEQNEQWMQGANQIANEASQLKKANTLSKYMEQQCDLVGQWISLMTIQSTNLASQLENIQVDLAYWISQKTEAQASLAAKADQIDNTEIPTLTERADQD